MKYIKIPFLLLWRAWFYVLMFVGIVLLSPILIILSSSEKLYPYFWKAARYFSYFLVFAMGFRLDIERDEEIDRDKSYVFCANHTSFFDIWLMIIMSKNPIVFVGKKELVKIPVFGFFYKRVVIMVDRSSASSRRKVYGLAKKRLKDGTSVAIYPEGLVPEEGVVLAPFKNGAFSLAIELKIPIVPQIYFDCKRSFSWDIFKGGPTKLRAKQYKFIPTEDLKIEDRIQLKNQLFDLMYTELSNDVRYMKDTNKALDAEQQ
ncbi:lysophospholipid acyltransferase family protein [uncultured Tenacibaculum sp.]|uniref:lysophospholipid acyltransferase family protein n=1 Tax=uncultured Tenacibaculum sp. TaxID=174713 RepID=UPI00260BC611|nr:lysophospholipid acyltransferase family protein [uncultured Tenacibaculum sp.]